MYTKQQKEDMDTILKMFNDYLNSHMTADVLWSDKAGYLFGYLDSMEDERRTYEYVPVLSPQDLLDKFQEEFYETIVEEREEELIAQYGNETAAMVEAGKIAAAQVQKILEEHNSPIKYEYSANQESFYYECCDEDEEEYEDEDEE